MQTTLIILSIIINVILISVLIVVVLKKKTQANINLDSVSYTLKTETDRVITLQSELIRQTNNNIQNIVNLITLNNKQLEDRFVNLTNLNEVRLEKISNTVSTNLQNLQQDNAKKLEEMRKTVDEKLNVSLERRLNDSFSLINERLEAVYKGLGEMQNLAVSVGDLRSVLSNVKIRGNWGENSLNNLLEQLLTKEQYETQFFIPPKNTEKVDFAIKLPGKNDTNIYLPIDVKFPIEDYTRLVEASQSFNTEEVEKCSKQLLKAVKIQAKSIKQKYIAPPYTTDFAIMYLPIEGLYCEVVKDSGTLEELQRDFNVIVCGPSTISALLNSLQMGFKTLAIQKRSGEIWSLLNMFRKEFAKFCELLDKTQRKLLEASNTIEDAHKKTATIQRKLNKVTTLEVENNESDILDLIDFTDNTDATEE